MDLSQYIGLFVDESREHLQLCNNKLLELEHQKDNIEILNEIFRVAHTIKGMAATLVEFPYFEEIATLTHEMESLLADLRNGTRLVTDKIVDTLFSCMDGLEALVDNVSDPESTREVDFNKIHLALLDAMGSGPVVPVPELEPIHDSDVFYVDIDWEKKYDQSESEAISQAGQSGKNCFEIHVSFMPDCQMKSVRAFLVIQALEGIGEVVKTFPPRDDIMADKVGDKFSLTLLTPASDNEIKDTAFSIAEVAQVDTFNLLGETTRSLKAAPKEEDDDESRFTIPDFNEYERLLINEAHKQGLNTIVLGVHLFSGVLLKATRVTVILRALEGIGEIIKTIPSISDLEEERFGNFFEVTLITSESREKVVNILLSIAEVRDSIDVASVAVDENAEVFAVHADGTVTHQESKTHPKAEPVPAPLLPMPDLPLVPRDTSRESRMETEMIESGKGASKKSTQIVRVDADKLEQLMRLVGELVINRSALSQIAHDYKLPILHQSVAHLDSITADLQTVSMKLRMVPVEHVFNRFPRMVRDVAKNLNKEIDFIILGADTELDRTLIDDIGTPLVHMIRNAADHGLETPEDREKTGKSRKGRIELKARYDGQNVLISVSDDGRGLDVSKLKKKAVEKEIISAEQAIKMDDRGAWNLIFSAGLSTAEEATSLSGRGVGMDAVKAQIEYMGGRIDVESFPGQGTKFSIKLPLTLAILKSLLTRIGKEFYAIPLFTVEEVTEIVAGTIQYIQNYEVAVIRGDTIPVIDLGARLSVPGRRNGQPIAISTIGRPMVIVHVADKKCGLIVDDLIGQEDIVLKPLSRTCNSSEYISGAATLGNGQIALIVNPEALV